MSVLQPFDRHPADPGALTGSSSTLATQAASALDLDAATRRAHAPVPAHWLGVGHTEAASAARVVTVEARHVSGAVASAVVAVAAWARAVQGFNAEVDRIAARVGAAGTDEAAAGRTVEEIADIRLAARRAGEADWHAAYDTHIVAGRAEVVKLLKQGPSDEYILALFQAGLLPMAVVNLYPHIDFTVTDWRLLFANLRAQGIDPLSWAAIGTYSPAELRARLDVMRGMGVPPDRYKRLLQLYWVATAAEKAGIDLSQWDPNRGAAALTDILYSAYTYYGRLFLDHPYMQWAGMANMIGPSFAAAFFDLSDYRRIARVIAGRPGAPFDQVVVGHLTDHELRFFETRLLKMQKDIFFDQMMMHEAYLAGGMSAIRELEAAGLIDSRTERSWSMIDEGRSTGNRGLIEEGNTRLLQREQHDVIQGTYEEMYNRPVTGPVFTYIATAVSELSIPGARSFAEYRPLWVTQETPGPERIPFTPWDNPLQGEVKVKTPFPDANVAHFEDRWGLIEDDTMPAYQRLLAEDPQRARDIIASDVRPRIEDYRLHNRLDSLLEHYTREWEVDFDQ